MAFRIYARPLMRLVCMRLVCICASRMHMHMHLTCPHMQTYMRVRPLRSARVTQENPKFRREKEQINILT